MIHIDLFSGVGMFAYAMKKAGIKTVCFAEQDKFCQKVLAKHHPGVKIYDDVKDISYERLKEDGIISDPKHDGSPCCKDKGRNRKDAQRREEGEVCAEQFERGCGCRNNADVQTPNQPTGIILTGGFPCQDLSVAGKQAGIDGERSGLWGEFARIIGEIRPAYVIVENVSALLTGDSGAWMRRVLGDIAEIGGYEAEWHVIPAGGSPISAGAPHRRDRVWIICTNVGNAEGEQRDGSNDHAGGSKQPQTIPQPGDTSWEDNVADTESTRLQGQHERETKQANPCAGCGPGKNAADTGIAGLQGGKRLGQNPGEVGRGWKSASVSTTEPCAATGRESDTGQSESFLGRVIDGTANRLPGAGGRINGYAKKERPNEVLQTLQPEDETAEIQRQIGGHESLLAPGILQSLVHGAGLCQRCATKRSVPPESQESAEEILRELWGYGLPCSPSRRRELEKQLSEKHPDVMRVLSCHTPPPCKTCWSDGSWEDGVPRVATGVPDRVNKLKALGNGLVWQIPYAIIESILKREIENDRTK